MGTIVNSTLFCRIAKREARIRFAGVRCDVEHTEIFVMTATLPLLNEGQIKTEIPRSAMVPGRPGTWGSIADAVRRFSLRGGCRR